MKRTIIAAAVLLALPGAAFANKMTLPAVYMNFVDNGKDLNATERQNRLKTPDTAGVTGATSKGNFASGGKRGTMAGRRPVSDDGPAPTGTRAFGSFGIPYASTRVQDGGSSAAGTTAESFLSTTYPFSAIGKLTFITPQGASFCSASVIRRSVLVTAAHCVQDFGTNGAIFSNYLFRPGHFGKTGATTAQIQPFGSWKVLTVTRPPTWANGTDTGSGAARNNDLAIFMMRKNAGQFIGDNTGYFGYSWNNLGFTSSTITGNKQVAATSTLGYPALLDKGRIMQRADGPTYLTTVGGALQMAQGNSFTGGSSGGPWVLNFGAFNPVLSGGAVLGQQPFMAITGVTSWGSADPNVPKDNFSSRFGQNPQFPLANYGGFGAGNIGSLLQAACIDTAPEGGTFAANGYCD